MMTENTREHLSSLMDGEISRETSRFLVRRLGTDTELQETWSRWHVMRDCMRYPDSQMASDDLRQRIGVALADSEVPRQNPFQRRWLKPVSGMAVAASVALMAVVAVNTAGPGSSHAPVGSQAVAAEPFSSPQGLSRPAAARLVSSAGEMDEQRMNAYILRHHQATGSGGSPNFVSFVPILVKGSATQPLKAEEADSETRQASSDLE